MKRKLNSIAPLLPRFVNAPVSRTPSCLVLPVRKEGYPPVSVFSVCFCSAVSTTHEQAMSSSDAYGRPRTGTDAIFVYFPTPQAKPFGTQADFVKTAGFDINCLQPQKWDTCPKALNLKPQTLNPVNRASHSVAHLCTLLHTSEFFPTNGTLNTIRTLLHACERSRTPTSAKKLFAPPAFKDFPKDFHCEGG